MAEYKIPVIWEVYGFMRIEASSLELAILKAIEEEPLPEDTRFLEESFEIDWDGIEGNPEEIRKVRKLYES